MTDEEFKAWLKGQPRRVVLVEATAQIAGVETTLYLSNRPWGSGAADVPANQPYDACIVGGATFSEKLSLDGSPATLSYGDFEIANRGGVRDVWKEYIWDNRAVRVYVGDAQWARSDFRLVFDGLVATIDTRDSEVLNLRLVDKSQRLNRPITTARVGGTGPDKDELLPVAFGECFNVQPVMTNAVTLEYQVHQDDVEDFIETRSAGAVPVTITKHLDTGKFTLGVNPAGTPITASIQGDAVPAYSNNIAEIVERIVTRFGPASTRFSGADLDTANLDAFAAANAQPVGYYARERVNQRAACDEIAGSIGAQVVMTTLGLLRLVQLALPPSATPTEVSAEDFEYHSLHIAEFLPVKAAVRLQYCRNWTPMTQLAAGVPVNSAKLYKNEWLTVTASDAAVAADYNLDDAPAAETSLLLVTADAQAEAQRRLDLWKTPRVVYEARYFAHMLLTELGDALTLQHPRFGLQAGATGIVVSIERDWLKGRVAIGVLA
jgi:hypothetical protein